MGIARQCNGGWLTVDQPEGILGVEPDLVGADPDCRAILCVQHLAQPQHVAVSDIVGEPAVGDSGEPGSWDARQGVEQKTVQRDSQEESSAEDQAGEGEACDQAGSVRDPAEHVHKLGWHSHWQ